MDNKVEFKISCPYCGCENSSLNKTCDKCGNRIPESYKAKAMEKLEEPPIAINEDKNEATTVPERKPISPLKKRPSSDKVLEILLDKHEEPRLSDVSSVVEVNGEAVHEEDSIVEEPVQEVVEEATPEKIVEIVENVDSEIEIEDSTAESGEIDTEEIKDDYEMIPLEEENVQPQVSEVAEKNVEEEPVEEQKEEGVVEEVSEPVVEPTDENPIQEEINEEVTVEESPIELEDSSIKEAVEAEEAVPVETAEENEEDSSEDESQSGEQYVLREEVKEEKSEKDSFEEELNDEIFLHDEVDGEEVIDIKPQNDIVKIKNDISEFLKAQEEIDLDTTVCLNVPDVMDALNGSDKEDYFDNTQLYPNLEGELYEATNEKADNTGDDDNGQLYEEDFTDLETREYQLDMQVLEDKKKTPQKNNQPNKLVNKIKSAHKENKEKKAADGTRLNIPYYILGVLLRPLHIFGKEDEKLGNVKNVVKLALVIVLTMSVLGLLKEMLSAVRVTSFWTGKISWVWNNLGDVKYFKVLGENLLIFTGVIFGLSAIYYIVSTLMKKKTDVVKLVAVVCTSFVPFGICYGLLSLVLSLVYAPLGVIVTIIGFIYSMLILLQLIDELIVIEEKNKRLMFHLICLSILFIVIGMISYSYLVSLA